MNFGTYTGALLNGTSIGTVTCAGAWNISLNAGTGSGATETIRKMTGPGGATLNYQVFSNTARNINWGNTTGSEPTGTGSTSVTFYGQIMAGQMLAPGTYTDTLTSATTAFTVSATLQASCLIPTTTALNFGTYKGAQLDSTTTISITCTNTTPYNIGVQTGLHGSGNSDWELLGPSSNKLSYKIYTDPTRMIYWGTSVPGSTVNGKGNGSAQSYSVYGRIAAGQYVIAGAYSDTITFTLYY